MKYASTLSALRHPFLHAQHGEDEAEIRDVGVRNEVTFDARDVGFVGFESMLVVPRGRETFLWQSQPSYSMIVYSVLLHYKLQ